MAKKAQIIFLILFFSGSLWINVYGQEKKEEARDLYRLGEIYYQQGRYQEAEQMFQKALDLLNTAAPPTKPAVKEVPAQEAVQGEKPAAKPQPQSVLDYIIGEGDVLKISVWQNPDLDQEVTVRPDGKISFPLIGDVIASGLTLTALDEEMTNRLQEYVKYPTVSISLTKMGGSRVIILGQVTHPGVYAVPGGKTIAEAVAMAGGLTRDAVASSTVLIRGGFTTPNAQRINLSKLLKGDVRQNIVLQSQDIVFVPRKFISDLNYFLTQILDPLAKGAYTKREFQAW